MLASMLGLGALVAAPAGGHEAASTATYSNPVFPPVDSEVRGFPDPSVIRGRDGYFYAYATGRDFRITRSADLVSWELVGTIFTDETRPAWIGNAGNWAPDVSYVSGQYVATYTVADGPIADRPNRAVGIATAPSPTGPWTDKGAPLLEPEYWHPTPNSPEEFRGIMDSDLIVAPDGRPILYYGGMKGGLWAVELSRDLQQPIGERRKVASEHTFEAAYVVQREGWFYLMASSGGCCSGEVSGYTVMVGRSRDPYGPFHDRAGQRMDGRRPGGTPVVGASGNTWTGVGHHSIVSDLAGQDWMVYHGIDRTRAIPPGDRIKSNPRPMLIDRLDWIDGWPTVRSGRWASDKPQAAPAMTAPISDAVETQDTGARSPWRRVTGWTAERESDGGFWRSEGRHSTLVARRVVSSDLRARAAVRLATTNAGQVGFRLGVPVADATVIEAYVDGATRHLRVTQGTGATSRTASAPLPESLRIDTWHDLVVTIRADELVAELVSAGIRDVAASVSIPLSVTVAGGAFSITARGAADVDDISVTEPFAPPAVQVPDPVVGPADPNWSDEFDGAGLSSEWSWIREAGGVLAEGQLRFPIQPGDLSGDGVPAPSLLLREPPPGDWTVEAKLTLDFGDEQPDDLPQAGLVVYQDDDNFLRLAHSAHGAVEHVEFGKEMTLGTDRQFSRLHTVAPPGRVTWLRLQHTVDTATGDHVYRAAVSTDGENFVWSMAYTMGRATSPRIGVVSHGGVTGATPSFDYVRFSLG